MAGRREAVVFFEGREEQDREGYEEAAADGGDL